MNKHRMIHWSLRVVIPLLVTSVGVALAAVTISSFTATVSGGAVVVRWHTSYEDQNQGFYIQRSHSSDSGFEPVSPMIFSTPAVTANSYTYTDTQVTPGTSYYYRLEAVNNSGFSEYTAPIWLTVPLYTQTPTPTSGTPTRTPSPRPPTPTSRTPTQPARTATPTQTSTPTETPTLEPLPSMTLLFPIASPTGLPTSSPTPPGGSLSEVIAPPNLPGGPSSLLLGGLIVVIWVLLGVFLYVYIKRLGY